jgi:hypothetical protein
MTVDETEALDPLHARLAEKYLRDQPWSGWDNAVSATAYQFQQDLEERDRGDDETRARMDRLYPEFAAWYADFVARQAAGGFEPPAHPSPNPPAPGGTEPLPPAVHAGTTPAAPVVPESVYKYANQQETHHGKISEEHGERALRYMRDNGCSWQRALFMTNTDPVPPRR